MLPFRYDEKGQTTWVLMQNKQFQASTHGFYIWLEYTEQCGLQIAKLSSSWLLKWLVELRLALCLIITTPTPTRESRDAAWYWPYMVSM